MPRYTTCRTARPVEDFDKAFYSKRLNAEGGQSSSTGLARKISNSQNMILLTNQLITNKESTMLAVILRAAS